MALNKKQQQQITQLIHKQAQHVPSDQQEWFTQQATKIETEFNDQIFTVLNHFRNNASQYLNPGLPLNPGQQYGVLELTANQVKELIQIYTKTLQTLNNPHMQVCMIDALKESLEYIQTYILQHQQLLEHISNTQTN
jgi:hypothetical protein